MCLPGTGDLFWGVESPDIPARVTESQGGPSPGTRCGPGARPRPGSRPASAPPPVPSTQADPQPLLFVAAQRKDSPPPQEGGTQDDAGGERPCRDHLTRI